MLNLGITRDSLSVFRRLPVLRRNLFPRGLFLWSPTSSRDFEVTWNYAGKSRNVYFRRIAGIIVRASYLPLHSRFPREIITQIIRELRRSWLMINYRVFACNNCELTMINDVTYRAKLLKIIFNFPCTSCIRSLRNTPFRPNRETSYISVNTPLLISNIS